MRLPLPELCGTFQVDKMISLCFLIYLTSLLMTTISSTYSFTRRRSKTSRSFCHRAMLSSPTPRARSSTRAAQSQQLHPTQSVLLEAATSFGLRRRLRSLNGYPNHPHLRQVSSHHHHRHHGMLTARLGRIRNRTRARESHPMSHKRRPGRSH
jgi:hypothetical protein